MTAFDILATKGITRVAGAAITPEYGMWSMTPDGWSQHGTGKLEPYDKHKVAVAVQIDARTLVSWRGVAVSALVCAFLMLLLAVGA